MHWLFYYIKWLRLCTASYVWHKRAAHLKSMWKAPQESLLSAAKRTMRIYWNRTTNRYIIHKNIQLMYTHTHHTTPSKLNTMNALVVAIFNKFMRTLTVYGVYTIHGKMCLFIWLLACVCVWSCLSLCILCVRTLFNLLTILL